MSSIFILHSIVTKLVLHLQQPVSVGQQRQRLSSLLQSTGLVALYYQQLQLAAHYQHSLPLPANRRSLKNQRRRPKFNYAKRVFGVFGACLRIDEAAKYRKDAPNKDPLTDHAYCRQQSGWGGGSRERRQLWKIATLHCASTKLGQNKSILVLSVFH